MSAKVNPHMKYSPFVLVNVLVLVLVNENLDAIYRG
jgi:hypothetical protein